VQVLPQDRGNDDFWWHGLNACTAISECGALSLAGGDSAAHHMYYDMYTLTQDGAEASVHDVSARDGAEWRATLTGYVALVQQNTGAGAGFFLACRSSLPVFGGALVGSYRSDVGAHMSVGDFAESKEVWFLRHANNRNRRRLLAMAAAALDLTIETCVDNLASDPANAPKLAVNCAETLFEDLQHGDLHDALANECAPLGSAPHTNAHVRVVRHFIGCVDAGRARGPVLFDMGARQGLAAFMPLEAQHLALESATGLTFPMLQTAALALLPVVNVHEKTRNDAEFAHNIVRELPSMEPHDVLYGAQHTSTQLPASVCALCQGPRAMYAKRYPQHLGTVLYPAQPCVMLSETASACRNTCELPQFLITALENRRFTSTPTQTLLQHMAFSIKNKVEDKAEDTAADAEPVCLEVDTTLLETALYLAAPSHPLVPLLLFKPVAA